jgi:hypothetical protein
MAWPGVGNRIFPQKPQGIVRVLFECVLCPRGLLGYVSAVFLCCLRFRIRVPMILWASTSKSDAFRGVCNHPSIINTATDSSSTIITRHS